MFAQVTLTLKGGTPETIDSSSRSELKLPSVAPVIATSGLEADEHTRRSHAMIANSRSSHPPCGFAISVVWWEPGSTGN
jgi:hypothetical protein